MTKTIVYLVRHGETAWNAAGRCQGTIDVPLNAVGRAQASALRTALSDVDFSCAYSSPLSRARETAAIVLAGRITPVYTDAALRELSYGRWQGRAPNAWPIGSARRWTATPWHMTFPGGECLEDVYRRVTPFWDRLVRAHAGEIVLLVTHGHINRLLLLHALGWPRDRFWAIPQDNACYCVLRVAPGNHGGHLAAMPLSNGADHCPSTSRSVIA